jgi:transposase-like protein
MLSSDEWKSRVFDASTTICPACESTQVTMGACAIGSYSVHQEYTCENCQHVFTALFALADFYQGHPEQ